LLSFGVGGWGLGSAPVPIGVLSHSRRLSPSGNTYERTPSPAALPQKPEIYCGAGAAGALAEAAPAL
jgi:hypothetical protein